MKKELRTICVLNVFTVVLILAFTSCTKENSAGRVNIIGKWVGVYKYDNARLRQHTYRFNADSTVEATIILTDSASGKLLSYQYKSNGRFRLNGESLKLYHLASFYNNQDKAVIAPEGLVPLAADTVKSYTVKFNKTKTSFYFYYPPCPPNASCAAQIIFTKQ